MAAPLFPFVGSKRGHAAIARIEELWRMHPHDMYVEPFVGGGAVFLTLQSLGILSEAEVWLCAAASTLNGV
jgi:site-specific DNA-adenine methylase